jgi:hypothetical protein
MDDTAMSSAEVAEVTAKKRRIKRAAAPDLPSKALAAAAAGRPAETSASKGQISRQYDSMRMVKLTWCKHFHVWIATESDGRQTKSSGQSKRDSKPIAFTIVSVTDIITPYRVKQCVPCQTAQQVSFNSASWFTRNCTLPVRFIIQVQNKIVSISAQVTHPGPGRQSQSYQ